MDFLIDPIELTQQLVRMNSINPPGNEQEIQEFLRSLLQEHGFHCEFHDLEPGRPNLIARLPETVESDAPEGVLEPDICFTGHVDTVPLGESPWSVEPLAAEIVDGRMIGRGVSDMKAGVAALIVAAIEMSRIAVRKRGLTLVLTAGEECDCQGARKLAQTPEVLGTCGAVVVAEPTGNQLMMGHKGVLWLRLRFKGKAAHGSMPDHGENAIYKASRAALMLENFFADTEEHFYMGKPSLAVTTMTGGTKTNIIPESASLEMDIRTVAKQDHSLLVKKILLLAGQRAEVDILADNTSIWTEPDEPFAQVMTRLAVEHLGDDPQPKAISYFTDASILSPAYGNVPTFIVGPGEAHQAHQKDEWCKVENIPVAAGFYLEVCKEWCL